MSAGTSTERDAVIWCAACGIPYAPGTPYCGSCRQPLDLGSAGDQPVAPAPRGDSAAEPPQTPRQPESPSQSHLSAEDALSSRPPAPLRRRARRAARPQRLTEDEIEARAAAIVAQARVEELAGVDESPRPVAPPDPALAAEALAYLEFLPPLRDRDRHWLAAGVVCCVVLIIFTVFFVRYLAG